MSAYAIFEVKVLEDADPATKERYAEYRRAVPELVERYGGRYVVRAAQGRALEGRPVDDGVRWHIVEFPDESAAESFWSCDEYRALAPLRDGAAEVRAVLIHSPTR